MAEELQPLPIQGVGLPNRPEYFQSQAGDNIPSPFWMSAEAAAKRSGMDTPFGSAFGPGALLRGRVQDEMEAQGGKKLSPEELNKLYPDMESPFTQPTTRLVAQYLADQEQERRNLEYITSKGPEGKFYDLARFGAAMIPHALDPINYAGSVLTGGLFKAGGILQGAGITKEAGRVFAENVLANAASEIPVHMQNERELQKYGVGDSFENVFTGALGGVGFHFGLKGIAKGFGKAVEFLDRTPKAAEVAQKSALAQFANDKTPDVSPILKDNVNEINGKTRTGGAEYTFTLLANSGDRDFYHGSPTQGVDFKTSEKAPIGEFFGPNTIDLTDNPNVANGAAARKVSDADGRVYRVRLNDDLNLIDLEKPLDEKVTSILNEYIKDSSDFAFTEKGMDAFDEIRNSISNGDLPPEAMAELTAKLNEAGYDGVRYEGGNLLGVEGQKHNLVTLFDPAQTGDAAGKITETGSIAPDPSIVHAPTAEDAKALAQEKASFKADASYDAKVREQLQEFIDNPLPDRDLGKLKLDEETGLESLGALKEQGYLSPEQIKHLETIQDAKAKAELEEKVIKAAMFCLGKDI